MSETSQASPLSPFADNATPVCPACAALASASAAGRAAVQSRVVGGQPVTNATLRARYSFAVLLRVTFSGVPYQCGGSLVAPNVVLTAAHCLAADPAPPNASVLSARSVTVFLGWLDMAHYDARNPPAAGAAWPNEPLAEVVPASRWEWHGAFDTDMLNGNDLAVVWLSRSAQHARPVSLDFLPGAPSSSGRALALGWGLTANLSVSQSASGSLPTRMQRVLLPLVPPNYCATQATTFSAAFDGARQLCGATDRGVDTCYVRLRSHGETLAPARALTPPCCSAHSHRGILEVRCCPSRRGVTPGHQARSSPS